MATTIPENDIVEELNKIGVDKRALDYMYKKSVFRLLKLEKISSPAANIIKQEMLSIGGEVAVNKGCINCSVQNSDILIMGTMKQMDDLKEKLQWQGEECKKVLQELKQIC